MSIITDTSVETKKTESIPENYKEKPVSRSAKEIFESIMNGEEVGMEKELIEYSVRVREGDSSDQYEVTADKFYVSNGLIYFEKDGKVTWVTAICNLVYINNPQED